MALTVFSDIASYSLWVLSEEFYLHLWMRSHGRGWNNLCKVTQLISGGAGIWSLRECESPNHEARLLLVTVGGSVMSSPPTIFITFLFSPSFHILTELPVTTSKGWCTLVNRWMFYSRKGAFDFCGRKNYFACLICDFKNVFFQITYWGSA